MSDTLMALALELEVLMKIPCFNFLLERLRYNNYTNKIVTRKTFWNLIMERLFASWRMKYISSTEKQQGCVFCNATMRPHDDELLVVHVGEHAIVLLNKFPYTSGHIMVSPKHHTGSIQTLSAAARAELMELLSQGVEVLTEIYHPEGFNIGANMGKAAGAGIPEHLHFHIVPRWNGDTNFMTAVGETRVLPEDLTETHRKIRSAFTKEVLS